MVKKQVKLSGKSKKNKSMKKLQRGGKSSACVLPYSTSSPKYGDIGDSNIHNNNPQASLDLDNKFMAYGGPVPLGSSIVGGARKSNKKNKNNNNNNNMKNHKGGSSCRNEGVGTGSPKSETFKQYLNNMDSNLSSIINPMPNSQPQIGSGYTTDPSQFVGGLPVYKGYDDYSPPAIVGGKLVFGSPDQPVCGNGAVRGGGSKNRNHNSSKKNKSNKSNKSNKKSKQSKKSKKQRGGDFTTLNSSKPAEYSSAFNGPVGYFKYPDDMTGRTFDGRQPNYPVTEV